MFSSFVEFDTPLTSYSEVESQRFKRTVVRMLIPLACNWPDEEILKLVDSTNFELLILRSPSTRSRLGGALNSLPRVDSIQADSLMYFSLNDLHKTPELVTAHSLETSVGAISTGDLSAIIMETFSDYQNHYSANASLPLDAVQLGYAEWARTILSDSDGIVLTGWCESRPAGFIVVKVLTTKDGSQHAEIVLNGTHPKFRGRGVYKTLLHECVSELRKRRVEKLWISTQISNRVMIRTWEEIGFRCEFAVNTFHCSTRNQ